MIRLSTSTCRSGLAAGVFLLIVLPVVAAATPGVVPKDAVDVTVLENTPDRIVVHYEVQDFVRHSVSIDGEKYTRIMLGKESPFKVVGEPELPNIRRSLIIWDDAQVAVNVLDSAYYELADIDIMPSKGIISRQVDPDSVPYTFGEAYETDAFYPGALAELGDPYILRDFRGVVLQASPFQYNPVTRTLRVYTEMTVEVIPVGPAKINAFEAPTIEKELSLAFHQIYKYQFVNYEFNGRYPPLDETGDMLIICYDAWLPNIQPLVDHKNSIGLDTAAVGVSTIGNNSSSIKSHIQSRYNGSDLAFVLLVGDSAQVATYYSGGAASDPSYSLLAGGDNYPDILVGRFSAQSASQVDTQVLRTIEYEEMPATEQDWFKRGIGIASNEGDGYGDDDEADWQHMRNIRTDLLGYGYSVVDELYDGSHGGEDATGNPSASMVATAVNAGRGITNYCGHGWMQGWVTSGFSNSHVDALVNDNMLPFITSVACNTGEFNSGTCFAEAWLRATHGSEPTGAIGMYASSISQSWAPPMSAQDETVDLLVAEAYFSFGALCFAGSCQMMDEYGSGGVSEFKAWHVFGDPSLRVYGEAGPDLLNIRFPDGLPELLTPGEPTDITVRIIEGEEEYVPGSGTLYYRYDGGEFQTSPLVPQGGELYLATLPPAGCDDTPEFYFSAEGTESGVVYQPPGAPDDTFTVAVGEIIVISEDDFNTDQGWTVDNQNLDTGAWVRVVPSQGGGPRGQPEEDYDGSGMCFVTGNGYQEDVDGGYTWLISPTIDLSDEPEAEIGYGLWYTNNFGGDPNNDLFKTYVSNDDGANWVVAEVIGPQTPGGGWNEHSFRVADFVTPTSQVKVRFEASDLGAGSVVEAGIDAFAVATFDCEDTIPGDLDGDGDVDHEDLGILLADWGCSGGDCPGDCDGDGDTDQADLGILLANWGYGT